MQLNIIDQLEHKEKQDKTEARLEGMSFAEQMNYINTKLPEKEFMLLFKNHD